MPRIGLVLIAALTMSSVGPHSALLQNAGVANARTNGSRAASAWSTDAPYSDGSGFGSELIFFTSPPTSASVGVLTDGAAAPIAGVVPLAATENWSLAPVCFPDASVATIATPHVPARVSVGIAM